MPDTPSRNQVRSIDSGSRSRLKRGWSILKTAANAWFDDQATMQSAALAYYTIFSIAPLLVISIAVAGWVFGEDATRGQIFSTLHGFIGAEGARGIEAMVKGAAQRPNAGLWAAGAGIVTLLLGASSVFAQLQQSLDLIWKVRARPSLGIRALVYQRLVSFSMVIVIAFLLMVSLLVTAALSAAGKFVGERLPGGEALWQLVNIGVALGVTTLLFAAIYKVLPDVKLRWRDTWIGATMTALLFSLGKLGIGLYIGKSGVLSSYGAAASVIVVLLWVYYSACILYFGAELTRAFVTRDGRGITPKPQAELIELRGMEPIPSRSTG